MAAWHAQPKNVSACMCMYCMYWPMQELKLSQRPQMAFNGAATHWPHSGHSWAGSQLLFFATGDRLQDRPFWRTSACSTRWGGPKFTLCSVQARFSCLAILSQALSEMIWVVVVVVVVVMVFFPSSTMTSSSSSSDTYTTTSTFLHA